MRPNHRITSSRTSPRTRSRRRLGALLVGALAAGSVLTGNTPTGAAGSTESDVMAFLASFPEITVDSTGNCIAGSTDLVAYRNDRIVVRSTASNATVVNLVNNVTQALYGNAVNHAGAPERITFPDPPGPPGPVAPVISVPLSPRAGGVPHDIVGIARGLRTRVEILAAAPDYALAHARPYSHYWPSGYPTPITWLDAPRTTRTPSNAPGGANLAVGTGVKITVYDVGLGPRVAGELVKTTVLVPGVDDEQPNLDTSGEDPLLVDYPAGGHAKAIAGVLAVTAPGAAVEVVRINQRSGLLTDVDAARRIAATLRSQPVTAYPNILVQAFGTAACDVGPGAPGVELEPVGTRAVVDVVEQYNSVRSGGMVIVASAGNIATSRRHYPAAFEPVLSVGALDATKDSDGRPWTSRSKTAPIAAFSNVGSWVDVYTPGVALPTNHLVGLRFQIGGPIVDGKALVDGTSFSAPIMAAYLAEHMSSTGLTARSARDQLLNGAPAPLPRCGETVQHTGKAIALPSFDLAVTKAPTPETIGC